MRFDNGDVSLAGTLIVSAGDGPFPAVVLVSGSGSQDRGETLLGNRPCTGGAQITLAANP